MLYSQAGEGSGRSGVTSADVDEALRLLSRTPAGRAIVGQPLIVDNRSALNGRDGRPSQESYHADDWTDMEQAEGFLDPDNGQTVILRENIRAREGETAQEAVARVVLHERVGHEGFHALLASDATLAQDWSKLSSRIPKEDMLALERDYPRLRGKPDALALEWFAHKAGELEARARMQPGSVLAQMWEAIRDSIQRLLNPLRDPNKPMTREALDAHVRGLVKAAREHTIKRSKSSDTRRN